MKTNTMIVQRILLTHQWILEATKSLSQDQFSRVLGNNAPPVGWHLWHIARFADRLQASFNPPEGDAGTEIWQDEIFVEKWNLIPDQLGVLESGMEMEMGIAISFSENIGMDEILDYAIRCFEKLDNAVTGLDPDQFDVRRTSVRAYKRSGDRLVEAKPEETTTGADLIFHISHASRHLGSIEALLGLIE
jgi:hypothetical protein